MMNRKICLRGGVIVAIGCGIAAVVISQRSGHQKATLKNAPTANEITHAAAPVPKPVPASQPAAETNITAAAANGSPPRGPVKLSGTNAQSKPAAQDIASIMYNGYAVHDPVARVALNFVGEDTEATEYWIGAINDPTLPSEERKDLIEDLNEDGLSDPRHPGPQDLPLIVARLELIDELAPYSMDDVNAKAFQEAGNDLLGLLQGQPPK